VSFPHLPPKLIALLEGAALVPAPEVLLRLMRAVEDEGSSLSDIAAIVDKDPAIAARILAAANSSAFHRGRALVSLEDCLQLLGLRVVRSIAVCLSVQCVFARQADGGRIDLAHFWYHSLLTAELARALAVASGHARPGEAYLGGLLHDIGELALLSGMRGEYAAMLEQGINEHELSALELANFGATHADVGAWLVDQWQLDSSLSDSVLFHHAQPAQIAEVDLLSRIVWCAHAAAADGDSGDVLIQIAGLLQLSALEIPALLAQAQDRVCLLAEAMGIVVKPSAKQQVPVASFPVAVAGATAADGLLESMAETAILQAVQREVRSAQQAQEMLRALCESANLLFGIDRSAFLGYRDADAMIDGGAIPGQAALRASVRIPLATGTSVAARALRERLPVDTRTPMSLSDVQLCRALQSEGLLCLPLFRGERVLGVMLLGASAAQLARLRTRTTWLQSFSRIASLGMDAVVRYGAAAEGLADGALLESYGREQQIKRFSHEIGNPLSIIKSYLRLLENRLPQESGVQEELVVLKEEIERVVRIVRQLSSPPQTAAHAEIALNGVVTDLLTLYGESLFVSRGIAVQTRLDSGEPRARGDRDGLKQVLINLLKNASEALDAGGHIEIETSAAMVHEGVRYAGFAVQDSGPGIPLALVQRLYAPMPEPRPVPGERGMGLSIVGGLIRHMNGKVVCETRPGQGTRISVLLPLAENETRSEGVV
jgi:HD-like signal output (HDOD) protein/signal transduction histidine kinase